MNINFDKIILHIKIFILKKEEEISEKTNLT